jgi:transcriptional regulator with XRE-family HTH domain
METPSMGQRIRDARMASGFSQEDVADMLKRTRSAVSLWEKNYSEPNPENLRNLAEVFQVTTNYLSKGTGRKPPSPTIKSVYRRDMMTRFQRLIATGKFNNLLDDYVIKRIASGEFDAQLEKLGYRKK